MIVCDGDLRYISKPVRKNDGAEGRCWRHYEHIGKLAKRYLNAERYPAHSSNVKRGILKIKPEKIFYVSARYTEYLEK